MFREIRRKDRILDNELAIRLLEEAEYGFLAMSGINGYGYGIPINYVKEGDSIYFHCAPEGYKLECLRENPKVSFTVVGATQIVPGKFTTGYESTIAFGEMHLDLPEEERRYLPGKPRHILRSAVRRRPYGEPRLRYGLMVNR